MDVSNKLAVIETVANIGEHVANIASSVRAKRAFSKGDAIKIEVYLKNLQKQCQIRAHAELVRTASDEMNKTLQHMKTQSDSGQLQTWDAMLLEIQFNGLKEILKSNQSNWNH